MRFNTICRSNKTIITDILYTIKTDYLPDIDEIKQFPKIMFMSGKEDQIIPYTDSQATLEKFKQLGGETKEILYPGIGHIDFPSVLETTSKDQIGVVDHIKNWFELKKKLDGRASYTKVLLMTLRYLIKCN